MKSEFIRVEMKNNPAKNAELTGYQKIVREQAEKGFHYAGFIPVKSEPSGKLLEIDLVFQAE
ncbi:MAG: hypothetical protein ACFNYI_06670 [Eubacterium sp.]